MSAERLLVARGSSSLWRLASCAGEMCSAWFVLIECTQWRGVWEVLSESQRLRVNVGVRVVAYDCSDLSLPR